jgi:hypothetical protein
VVSREVRWLSEGYGGQQSGTAVSRGVRWLEEGCDGCHRGTMLRTPDAGRYGSREIVCSWSGMSPVLHSPLLLGVLTGCC